MSVVSGHPLFSSIQSESRAVCVLNVELKDEIDINRRHFTWQLTERTRMYNRLLENLVSVRRGSPGFDSR